MFLGIVACLLFFDVLSSQRLTARIKPNRTSFVFESGTKPNVTCESDCKHYNWMCIYMWIIVKNKELHTYIDKNNSRIDIPLKENVTLMCYVEYEHYKIYDYSKRINIFIKEILLSTTTPIYDGKNDNDERTNITKESEYPPSSVIIFPSNDTIYTKPNGKPAQDIMCKADCLPECTYAWYRENEYFTTGNNLFARESLDRTGSYRFRCHASNGIGSNSEMYSRWITVEVKDGPNNVTIKPSPSEKENDFLQLTCSASCYHECRVYRWYMYNNYNIRSEIRSTHILSFSSLSKTNRGKYQCEVTDDFGTNSANYTVNVQYSPKGVTIQYSSWYRHLIEGQDYITFTCNADCNPGCSYLYYQNGKLLNKRYINERVYRNMSGRYTCSAKNSIIDTYKNSSNSQDINIRYGPKTANVWRNYQTISGDIIEKEDTSMTIPLRCWSSCNPSCEVAWYKDGQLESRGNPVINITRDRRMSGVYQCEASGVEGKVKSAQEHVTIQYPPEIVTINQGNGPFYTKRNGKPLHDITCKADCLPECTYRWNMERYPYIYTRGNSLFASKSLSHSGSYKFQCIASNNIGSSSFRKNSRWITVVVKDGPDNVTIIPSSSEIENETFQLLCSASCYPVCQSYRWYYNGKRWDQGTQYLTFNYLSKDDSGDYWCQVTDYFGTTGSQLYKVDVQYVPKNVTIHYSSRYEHLIEGRDEITLTCNANCNPACSYQFYQNGKLLNYPYTKKAVYRNMSGRYTCSAKNSVVDTYRNSSNFVVINIKYKPTITSFVNRKILTAPSQLDLIFSVDGSPSSNVSIFHKTKRLTFLPNVTGQLTFNVSVESCLDQGKYRLEAVNDAGYGDFTFIANVECSPVIVTYSYLSQKGYQVGDSLSYRVDFMSNPEAEVSWTFIDWNNKEPKELEKTLIQNQKVSTMVIIDRLNLSNFGKYELELKNYLGKIKWEFNIQGPPQSPTDLNVDCPRSAIISWRPGFDGGATQDFVIEYSDNSSYWLTHHPQSVVSVDNNFMSAQIHDIRPNIPYSFRIRAKNSFGVAASDTTVNCTWQNNDEMTSFLNNQNALVGIGVFVLLLLIAFAALVALIKLKRRRESNNQDNSLRKQGNNSNEEDNASEIVENILYITADDAKEQVQAPVDTPVDTTQNGSDVYAVVEKKPKTDDRDDQPVYTDVCKADQKKKKPAIAAKPSKVKKDERPTVNKDGLIYVDLDLKDTPSTSTEAFVIHGADDRTQYVDIDFTRRADPPPDTDNGQSQNEKEKGKA